MYLIPANSKKGQLLFNIFRPIDFGIFIAGVGVSLLLMLTVQSMSMGALTLKIGPVLVCSLLVMPVPNYHNVMMFIKDMILFYFNRRCYVWKGWCVNSEYTEDK